MTPKLLLFSDLDGCLLNKHDYDWRPAERCLRQLAELNIPLILATSKTVSEVRTLLEELPIQPAPFIAENGGAIDWGPLASQEDEASECTDIPRSQILNVLARLHTQYRFRSFQTLGISGVMAQTDLTDQQARLALDRSSTEPLIWDDSEKAIEQFREHLSLAGLTLTRGGRFWHVAGKANKGVALMRVAERYDGESKILAAIGDSQIDQSMLNTVDIPVGIRVNGTLSVNISCPPGIIPESEGAAGWAEAVTEILNRIN